MKVFSVTILILFMHSGLFAQTRTIKGIVTDVNYVPVKGVTVLCSPGNASTKTDYYGKYKITCPDSTLSVVFSKAGYKPQTAQLYDEEEINVILTSSELVELSLDELLQVNVSTVTLKEQKITDAPGIVSVITHEDLKSLGIRTVREALLLIPGFVPLQNDDEQILAIRGIFATTNQKILVMRDGHSLNEANIDLPQTDYSLSLENIKKIEIIRGPGASIYGNSALAAVVNIITIDNDETRVNLGFGNFGQYNIDAASRINLKDDISVLVYGRYAGAAGESFSIPGQNLPYKVTYKTNNYSGNYDFGFKYKLKNVTTDVAIRRHVYNTYWSAQGYYTNIDSLLAKPRLMEFSLHFNLAYQKKINEYFNLEFQHFADYCQLTNTRLLTSIGETFANKTYPLGRIQLSEWNVFKGGLNYFASWIYSDQGQLLGGVSMEQRRYLDTWLASNTVDSLHIEYSRKPFFPESYEHRGAVYFQVQHTIMPWLKIDVGARYDIAENFKETFNPRIALIANPMKPLTIKAIYTKAFQAPGYSYRTSNADFSGSIENLNPEKLTTYQGSARYDFEKASFIELSLYYNKLSNLISRPPDKNYYANFGKMASLGMEVEAHYHISFMALFGNYSLLLPNTNFMDSIFRTKNIHNKEFRFFPKHTVNSGISLPFLKKANISIYGQYASSFYAIQDTKLKNRLLLNSTININLLKHLDLTGSIYNLMNKRYKLGDPSVVPIEQPGRWFMVSLTYNFKK